jgi:hypothetical protein
MYVKGSTFEIQALTHWNLTGRSMAAPDTRVIASCILSPLSSHCAFIPTKKNWTLLNKYYFNFFNF